MTYDIDLIKRLYDGNIASTARKYAYEKNITYTDSLRRGISRKLKGLNLPKPIEAKDNSTTVEETKNSKNFTYKGRRSITSLQEAIEFFEIDLNKWEVDRWVSNSWDVTTGEGNTYTNYQVKVWLVKKEQLENSRAEEIRKSVNGTRFNFNKPEGGHQMWVVIGCVHRPFHDKELWENFLHFLYDVRSSLHGLIINGDYLDLRTLSSHDEGCIMPDDLKLSDEYADGYKGLLEIKKALGKYYNNLEKVFQFGNHEDRYNRHIKKYSNSHYGSALQSPVDGMRLEDLGYKVNTSYKNGFVTLGNRLDVYHGESTSKTPCKTQLQNDPERSHLFNHTHRVGYHSNGMNTAHNAGWMGDLESGMFDYMMRTSRKAWQKGFAVVHIDKFGDHAVQVVEVRNHGFSYGTKMYMKLVAAMKEKLEKAKKELKKIKVTTFIEKIPNNSKLSDGGYTWVG